jgi:hypothetical protein
VRGVSHDMGERGVLDCLVLGGKAAVVLALVFAPIDHRGTVQMLVLRHVQHQAANSAGTYPCRCRERPQIGEGPRVPGVEGCPGPA